MDLLSDKFKKLILNKLSEDLSESVFFPFGGELWVMNIDGTHWYLQTDNIGRLWYHQKFFENFFLLFGLQRREYQPLILNWFENLTGLYQTSISRRNTDNIYILEKIIRRDEKMDWTIFDRYGFCYPVVKKYVDLKKNLNTKYIKLKDLY